MIQAIEDGNKHCFQLANNLNDQAAQEKIKKSDLSKRPCRIYATANVKSIDVASKNLLKDKFYHECCSEIVPRTVDFQPENENAISLACTKVKKLMTKLNHRLYRGNVYKKHENGKHCKLQTFRKSWFVLFN